jgi:hypothetical protein
MSTVTSPTSPTFSIPIPAASFATGVNPGVLATLDLTTKFGAFLTCRIGRNVATALTRAGYIAVRRTINNTVQVPSTTYDFVSSIAAVNATTLNGAASITTKTAVLTTNTGFATGQTVCLNASGSRIEFAQVLDLTTSTITIDQSTGWVITHNSGDTITWGADVGTFWIPGGDIWTIAPNNNSGQTLIMGVDAAVYASDTSV